MAGINRRTFSSAAALAAPSLAFAGPFPISHSRIVDLIYKDHYAGTVEHLRVIPLELWFGVAPPYESELWWIQVQDVYNKRVRNLAWSDCSAIVSV